VGYVTSKSSAAFGLQEGIAVVNGSGDGFLANVGSDCETPSRIAVTLGTSAAVRQSLPHPLMDDSAGTFCYRADQATYLLGCAGSNGGNVLEWAHSIFGEAGVETENEPPIFIPLLHGERSPEWNGRLRGSWHDISAKHSPADLHRSVLEGVIFNIAHFVEIVQGASGYTASDIVISGGGFRHPSAAGILAAVTGGRILAPSFPGSASLRGAAIWAMRALSLPAAPLETHEVLPLADPGLNARYNRYRSLRLKAPLELRVFGSEP